MRGWLQRLVTQPYARALLDHPFVFSGFRFFIVGTQSGNKRRLRAALAQQRPSRVLDVCCGVGDFAGEVDAEYEGIDLNARFIALARRRYARTARKRFDVVDATKMHWPAQAFDATLFINCMHHFPTGLVQGMLREVARVTKHQVVVLDLEPRRGHWLQRFVMACDRGDHVRPIEEQRRLLEEFFDIEACEVYPVVLTVQTFFICRPKRIVMTHSSSNEDRVCDVESSAHSARVT